MRPDDSIFEPEIRDATGELRELVQEVMEQEDGTDTARNLALSGAALLVLCVLVCAAGLWMVRTGMHTTVADLVGHDRRHPEHDNDTLVWLTWAGMGVSFVGAILGVFALVSFAKIVAMKVRARDS
jgi:hypothetical protein